MVRVKAHGWWLHDGIALLSEVLHQPSSRESHLVATHTQLARVPPQLSQQRDRSLRHAKSEETRHSVLFYGSASVTLVPGYTRTKGGLDRS